MTKVYLADTDRLEDPVVFQKLYRTVPVHRQEKIVAIRFPKGKRLSLGAWFLLMHALREAGVTEENIRLSYGPSGKPYLQDFPNLFFSLSHSENRVMCAVSFEEVGCDVEKIKAANMPLAERFFCREEYDAIVSVPPAERDEVFFRFWTLKESFIKNVGRGLSLPLSEFSIQLRESGAAVTQNVMPGQRFYFREFQLRDGYRYACCARQPGISAVTMVLLPEE